MSSPLRVLLFLLSVLFVECARQNPWHTTVTSWLGRWTHEDQAIDGRTIRLRASELGGKFASTSLSPFIAINATKLPPNPTPQQLSVLSSTTVQARISGVVASVKIAQVYQNNYEVPIEAVYVFPASTRAAVNALQMTIGGHIVVAKIEDRDEARRIYEKAKSEGKSASLLEQERPNVLVMNVANIPPHDSIKIELFYTEMLVPTNSQYDFIYPAVVGPRYTGEGGALTTSGPYVGSAETLPWSLSLTINAGMELQSMGSSTHAVTTNLINNRTTAVVSLSTSAALAAHGKDFSFKYTLSGGQILTGFMAYQNDLDFPDVSVAPLVPMTVRGITHLVALPAGRGTNFFLGLVQPPVPSTPGLSPAPREFLIVLDVSGSMSGLPLATAKKATQQLLQQMREGVDTFNILQFAGGSGVLSPTPLAATAANIAKGLEYTHAQSGGGGTNMLDALRRAVALPRSSVSGSARITVVLTDGFVTVEKEVFQLVRDNLHRSSFWCMSIGENPNRYLTEGMAAVGRGTEFWVPDAASADAAVSKLVKTVSFPVMTNVAVSFNGFNAVNVVPSHLPDLLLERPVVVFGQYTGALAGTMTISGTLASGAAWSSTVDIAAAANTIPPAAASALPQLWASSRLSELRYTATVDEAKALALPIALKYSLLSEYTSFIAVAFETVPRTTPTPTTLAPTTAAATTAPATTAANSTTPANITATTPPASATPPVTTVAWNATNTTAEAEVEVSSDSAGQSMSLGAVTSMGTSTMGNGGSLRPDAILVFWTCGVALTTLLALFSR